MEFFDIRHPITAPSLVVKKVLDYLTEHDLNSLDDGHYEIDGERFYFNLFTFQSSTAEERIWEAHRKYIDAHIVLTGEEMLGQQFLPDVECGKYHPENDYLEVRLMAENQQLTRFILKKGYIAVFYPEDAHQTGVSLTEQRTELRKAVFKIKI